MKTLRKVAVAAAALVMAGALAACTSTKSGSDNAGGDGDGDGTGDAGAACQKLITNAEMQRLTGISDLHFDPTGSAVGLPNDQACPYQNAAGVEVIVSLYTGKGYTDGFQMIYQIARTSPNPEDVPGVGKGAVWVDVANQLNVDLGGKGIEVEILYKGAAETRDSIANPKDTTVAIAKVVAGRA